MGSLVDNRNVFIMGSVVTEVNNVTVETDVVSKV